MRKKCSEFSQRKIRGEKNKQSKHNAGDKGHAFLSNQMLDEEKTPTKSNPVSAEMDVYSKIGGISPAQLPSIINYLQIFLLIKELKFLTWIF